MPFKKSLKRKKTSSGGRGMTISQFNASAKKIWFDGANLWVLLHDGRQLSVPLAYFPRLLKATKIQRMNYEFSGGGTGLHWNELDEDISVAGLLFGIADATHLRRTA